MGKSLYSTQMTSDKELLIANYLQTKDLRTFTFSKEGTAISS